MSDDFVQMYSLANLQKFRDDFIEELVLSAAGNKTSLSFIKNPIPKTSPIKDGETFQVMIIGGSKFESALVKKIGVNLQILSHRHNKVPNFKTKEIFLSFLEKQLDQKVKVISLNFAFGLKPILRNGTLDGVRSGRSGKEHAFAGLYGQTAGLEFERYIYINQKRSITVSCANDTICLLLSGLGIDNYDSIVAGIVGTGMNFAFFLNKHTAINLESDSFDEFQQTPTGKLVNKNSLRPGSALFEKEVAGAYLYKHFNLLKHQNGHERNEIKSTLDLDEIAKDRNHPDRKIAQKLFERSASLVACQIAGIYFYKNKSYAYGQGSALSLQYIMQGSLFWRGWNYKKMVEKYLVELNVPENGIKFIKIINSGIVGAAQLVTGMG